MGNIKYGIHCLGQPEKIICDTLIQFYEDMKALENDEYGDAKQAVIIIMALNDFIKIIETEKKR
jgi:hypothetical protein